MNLLISCIGRQTQLCNCFCAALGKKDMVVVADSDRSAPAVVSAEHSIIAPPFTSPGYKKWLINQCLKYEIDYIMTLSVNDLEILISISEELKTAGCHLIGAPPESLKIGQDKISTAHFAEYHNLAHPRTMELDDPQSSLPFEFPVVIKERFGRGSRGLRIVHSQNELQRFISETVDRRAVVVQEFIQGVEYGVDIVNDLSSKHVATLMRRKYRMKNGETDIAVSVADSDLARIGQRIGTALAHQGALDADFIKRDDTYYLLDLNIRFGGGYLFSHNAGADLPSVILAWMNGEKPQERWLNPTPGIVSHRCDGQVVAIDSALNEQFLKRSGVI